LSLPAPKKNWLGKFRRVTSSTQYLPEVDGLRFLAIFMVAIWMHTTHFIDEKFFSNGLITDAYWSNFVMEGGYGVSIFFMISGFILSLPFAKVHFNRDSNIKKISLKRYYLRRLIRLEPPYIIALIIFFIGNVWVLHKYSFEELLPHFFASAFYLHNTIYDSFSYVLPIAWSLEVEVQFYLLAPLLCCIYLIRLKYLRWAIFVAAIVASGIYNYQFIMGTVVKFFCCFGIGMLVTDFYCNKEKFISSPAWCFIIGIISLLVIVLVPTLTSFAGYWLKFFFTTVFFYTVLTNEKMKQIFSNKYLTIIGGMCYSVYLLHFGILSVMGRLLQSTNWNLSNTAYLPLYFLLFTCCILFISAIYFLLVEKPFMKLKPKDVN
jgi:peptidoglycan/LPS O-acetylase OafA/YrhL